jgi:hypothetical protein
MYRITDFERSRGFYEAIGPEFRRESPIVRNGELEATNYFFAAPDHEETVSRHRSGRVHPDFGRCFSFTNEAGVHVGSAA